MAREGPRSDPSDVPPALAVNLLVAALARHARALLRPAHPGSLAHPPFSNCEWNVRCSRLSMHPRAATGADAEGKTPLQLAEYGRHMGCLRMMRLFQDRKMGEGTRGGHRRAPKVVQGIEV